MVFLYLILLRCFNFASSGSRSVPGLFIGIVSGHTIIQNEGIKIYFFSRKKFSKLWYFLCMCKNCISKYVLVIKNVEQAEENISLERPNEKLNPSQARSTSSIQIYHLPWEIVWLIDILWRCHQTREIKIPDI